MCASIRLCAMAIHAAACSHHCPLHRSLGLLLPDRRTQQAPPARSDRRPTSAAGAACLSRHVSRPPDSTHLPHRRGPRPSAMARARSEPRGWARHRSHTLPRMSRPPPCPQTHEHVSGASQPRLAAAPRSRASQPRLRGAGPGCPSGGRRGEHNERKRSSTRAAASATRGAGGRPP